MDLFSFMGSMVWPLAAMQPDADGAAFMEIVNRPEFRTSIGILIGLIIFSQIAGIICYWLSSKIFVEREYATVVKALQLWISFILLGIAMVVVTAVVLPIAVAQGAHWKIISVLAGICLLTIALAFLIPMKIYAIGFFRTLGFYFMAIVFNIVLSVGANFGVLLVYPDFQNSMLALAQAADPNGTSPTSQALKQLKLGGLSAGDEIDRLLEEADPASGSRPSLRQRETAVRELQVKLNTRKKTLPPGDMVAARKFQDQLGRYLRLLEEVKFELAAESKGPPR